MLCEHILELVGMASHNQAHKPMDERPKLSSECKGKEVDATNYQQIIRSLHYVVHTRQDLTFTIPKPHIGAPAGGEHY
jgi:hypothetical protein